MTAWLDILLGYDQWVQSAGLVASLVGVIVSVWLAHEAWLDYRVVRHNGRLERLVARLHLRSQVVMLILQIGFALTSGLVLQLPLVPTDMAVAEHGHIVLAVIVARKILRLGLIGLLVVVAWRQAADRRAALDVLRLWTPQRLRP